MWVFFYSFLPHKAYILPHLGNLKADPGPARVVKKGVTGVFCQKFTALSLCYVFDTSAGVFLGDVEQKVIFLPYGPIILHGLIKVRICFYFVFGYAILVAVKWLQRCLPIDILLCAVRIWGSGKKWFHKLKLCGRRRPGK